MGVSKLNAKEVNFRDTHIQKIVYFFNSYPQTFDTVSKYFLFHFEQNRNFKNSKSHFIIIFQPMKENLKCGNR